MACGDRLGNRYVQREGAEGYLLEIALYDGALLEQIRVGETRGGLDGEGRFGEFNGNALAKNVDEASRSSRSQNEMVSSRMIFASVSMGYPLLPMVRGP